MGFMDKIKNAGGKIRGAADWVKDKVVAAVNPQHNDDDTPPPAPDTSRYLHVSVPLIRIDNPVLRDLWQEYFPVQKGQGQSRIVGNNQLKRVADNLGDNNKQRRKLRSRMKRRAAVLRAGASLQPNVQSALAGAA